MQTSFDFVSVVFETEFPLLRLQARSMARFLPESLCREIIVLDNSTRGMPGGERDALLAEYGGLRPRVRVLRPSDVARVPGMVGWQSQQVLKLLVAEHLGADRYVVLDAKNHFVDTPDVGFFQSPDDRARVNTYGYEQHPLRPNLEHVLEYVGVDPAPYVGSFTATVTPFVLDRELVLAMVADIEARSGRPFAEEFAAHELTEFFLYTAWIVARGRPLEDVFDFHQVFCPVVWPRRADRAGVEAAIAQARSGRTPLFAVHRRALNRLDDEGARALATYWTDLGLFESVPAAERFVRDFRAAFVRTERAKKVRELPYRAVTVLRRARHRLDPRSLSGQR